jgi:hypothetical protein
MRSKERLEEEELADILRTPALEGLLPCHGFAHISDRYLHLEDLDVRLGARHADLCLLEMCIYTELSPSVHVGRGSLASQRGVNNGELS